MLGHAYLNLDLIKQNYNPVSNLVFEAKLMQENVIFQICDKLQTIKLRDIF